MENNYLIMHFFEGECLGFKENEYKQAYIRNDNANKFICIVYVNDIKELSINTNYFVAVFKLKPKQI